MNSANKNESFLLNLCLLYEFFTYRNKKKLNTETQRHGENLESMKDESDPRLSGAETVILVSSFSSIILPPSSFFSVPLCLRVFS